LRRVSETIPAKQARATAGIRHALAVLLATLPAMADGSPPVILTWSGPDACPSGQRVVARVEELLSRAKRPGAPLVAEARITAERAGYRLDVSAQHGEDRLRRTVHAGACDELADAAALILALWIDPELLGEPQESEGAPEPATPGSAPPPAGAERDRNEATVELRRARTAFPVPADPSSQRLDWRVIAGPVVDYGSLPTLAPGLEVGGGVEVGRLAATLSSQWFPYSQRQIADESAGQPAKGGTFGLLTGMARLCYQPLERFPVAGCGAGELGALFARGYGTLEKEPRTTVWAALGPGFEVRLPIEGNLFLRGAGDVLFALRRPNFRLDNVGLVHEPQAVSLRLALGILLRFP
jgi:hypothetical protein